MHVLAILRVIGVPLGACVQAVGQGNGGSAPELEDGWQQQLPAELLRRRPGGPARRYTPERAPLVGPEVALLLRGIRMPGAPPSGEAGAPPRGGAAGGATADPDAECEHSQTKDRHRCAKGVREGN